MTAGDRRAAPGRRGYHRLLAVAVMVAGALLPGRPAMAEGPLVLVQREALAVPGAQAVAVALADYLGAALGVRLVPRASANALGHWRALRADPPPAIVLTEAHFTDYLAGAHGFEPLARLPGRVRHALATGPDTLLLGPDELEGRWVLTVAPPALAALRLLELFPDPVRRPRTLEARSDAEAVERLLSGEADVVMASGRVVAAEPRLNVVVDLEGVPAPALSVSAARAPEWAASLRAALLAAPGTPAGRRLLAALGVPRLVAAAAEDYAGYGRSLRGTWGFDPGRRWATPVPLARP